MYSAYVERTKKRAPAAEPKKKFRMGDDADELPEDERFDGSSTHRHHHHSTTFSLFLALESSTLPMTIVFTEQQHMFDILYTLSLPPRQHTTICLYISLNIYYILI
jgi:hypothetical protein